jgi:hypothetical protein
VKYNTIGFLLRKLILDAISRASLMKLAMRMLTVALVIMHYQFTERVDFFS